MKYALLVGINYGTIESLTLDGCIDDVEKIKKMLIEKCNVEKENIIVLRDDIDSLEFQPTNKNILQELENLTKKTNHDDICRCEGLPSTSIVVMETYDETVMEMNQRI